MVIGDVVTHPKQQKFNVLLDLYCTVSSLQCQQQSTEHVFYIYICCFFIPLYVGCLQHFVKYQGKVTVRLFFLVTLHFYRPN